VASVLVAARFSPRRSFVFRAFCRREGRFAWLRRDGFAGAEVARAAAYLALVWRPGWWGRTGVLRAGLGGRHRVVVAILHVSQKVSKTRGALVFLLPGVEVRSKEYEHDSDKQVELWLDTASLAFSVVVELTFYIPARPEDYVPGRIEHSHNECGVVEYIAHHPESWALIDRVIRARLAGGAGEAVSG
jgi:hypothetical protein